MVFELDDPWEVGFTHAEEYAAMFGNLDIPGNYVCTDGYNLGGWITNQRRVYTGEVNGRMTPEQIEKLNGISMIWDRKSEITWKNGYGETTSGTVKLYTIYIGTNGNKGNLIGYVENMAVSIEIETLSLNGWKSTDKEAAC